MIKITVPATSANLGPGFDCLGLALDLYNDFYIEEIEEGLVIEGCLEEFKNENNLFYVSFQKALSELNEAVKGIITATDRNGSSTSATMLRSITLRVIGDSEGDVTGIEDVHVVTEKVTSVRDGIFDLQGRRLNSEPTKGMYIKNGVKYVK